MDKKKILVIDDEQDLAVLLKMNLEGTGKFDVVNAFTGQEGVDKAKETAFDLVITDFNMPDMNGEQVIDTLKNMSPSIPVLLFSVYHDDTSTLSASVKDKASGIISKPIDHDELYQKISEVVK